MTDCLRCGKCCYWQLGDMPTPQRCHHLKDMPDGKTFCKIFKHPYRIGMKIGFYKGIPIRCAARKDDKIIINGKAVLRQIEGCPYNE